MTTPSSTTSEALFESARRHLVGGVNSPVRAFRGVGGTPRFFARGEGAFVVDADENRLIDYVLSWGPLVLGHADPTVVDAITDAARKGTSFGAPCELEISLADEICGDHPSLDRIRFVSSGTEATMSALRLARGATGRDGIVKCVGCYHGHGDSLLVKAGSGVTTLGLPDSPGVPADLARHTHTIPFNDIDAVESLFEAHGKTIAAFIVEPVAGNMGCIPPADDYLPRLRSLCDSHGVLLIFDEVMTGYRIDIGGAQRFYDVKPDLTTFGKVIGGGLPVGAFGGRADVMDQLAPSGPVYQAGTLSGNPLAMAAGLATLRKLKGDDGESTQASLSAHAARLTAGLAERADAAGVDLSTAQRGSMWGVCFRPTPPKNFDDAKGADVETFNRFFHAMLDEGVYLAPSAFEAGFVSTCHDDGTLSLTLDAAERAFARVAKA